MNETAILLTFVSSTVAHFIIACVTALFARHRVQYLSLTWVNGIFFAVLLFVSFFSYDVMIGAPGLLNPAMLLAVLCACFLQSIYPLSIPMPGFLQWQRMVRYAMPIAVLLVVYGIALLLGSDIIYVYTAEELMANLLSSDILLRICAIGLIGYYIGNIFMLPRRLTRHADVPRYLIGYCTALGMSVLFYLIIAIFYDLRMLCAYIIIFTLLNLYLTFRELETIALRLPKPVIEEVTEAPTEEAVAKAEQEDFNEANQQRFQRVQFWMQNNREAWIDSSFGRDRLCQEVGYNRHLLLQSVRSQGYNNVHDYINSYRIAALKQMIQRGQIRTVSESVDAGFGTTKTARACFQKFEGITLDEFLQQHK